MSIRFRCPLVFITLLGISVSLIAVFKLHLLLLRSHVDRNLPLWPGSLIPCFTGEKTESITTPTLWSDFFHLKPVQLVSNDIGVAITWWHRIVWIEKCMMIKSLISSSAPTIEWVNVCLKRQIPELKYSPCEFTKIKLWLKVLKLSPEVFRICFMITLQYFQVC